MCPIAGKSEDAAALRSATSIRKSERPMERSACVTLLPSALLARVFGFRFDGETCLRSQNLTNERSGDRRGRKCGAEGEGNVP